MQLLPHAIIESAIATERIKKSIEPDFEIPSISSFVVNNCYYVWVTGSSIDSYKIAQKIYEQLYEQKIKGIIFVGGREYASVS